jgi:iron-sulfur cluster insertion protein
MSCSKFPPCSILDQFPWLLENAPPSRLLVSGSAGVFMSVVQVHEAAALSMTDAAARKVNALLLEEGNPKLNLRVYVTGGGCSGFQYGFSFDETVNEDDTVIDREGAHLLVDSLSIQYLSGAVVDYEEGLQGSRFRVQNPMAATTCGCGMSFTI